MDIMVTGDVAGQVQWASDASRPAAARRWLARAVPRDIALPVVISIEQEGWMDIRGRWIPFRAHGVYHANPLSFRWQARLRLFPGVWIVAEDGQADGQGWGGARLWGVIPLGQRTEPEVLTTQVVRNLGELAWLPSFALTNPDLTWSDGGESAFEVSRAAGGRTAMVRFEVDEQGDVVRATSPSRPYDVPGGFAASPWHYTFSEHREFDGVRIPAAAVATFEKSDGAWEYFRGRITAVRFEVTAR